MEILLLFCAFLVCCVAAIGVELRFPRDTDDFYQPDIDRALRREEKKERIRKAVADRRR